MLKDPNWRLNNLVSGQPGLLRASRAELSETSPSNQSTKMRGTLDLAGHMLLKPKDGKSAAQGALSSYENPPVFLLNMYRNSGSSRHQPIRPSEMAGQHFVEPFENTEEDLLSAACKFCWLCPRSSRGRKGCIKSYHVAQQHAEEASHQLACCLSANFESALRPEPYKELR